MLPVRVARVGDHALCTNSNRSTARRSCCGPIWFVSISAHRREAGASTSRKNSVRACALSPSDLLPMDTLPSVEFIQGDFREDDVLGRLESELGEGRADLVLSDMAPNISGNKSVDQPRSMYLAELALDLCERALRPGGDFVCKLFQGEGTDAFIENARRRFGRVRVMKPDASRPGSREVYLVARNYQL